MRDYGRVKFFLTDKGYGFITRDDNQDFFVHVSNVLEADILEKGQRVEFDIGRNERNGRSEAKNVKVLS